MLRVLNHGAHQNKENAKTSFDLYRLFESISRSGTIDANPRASSTYYLLDTLAKSHKPGYGDHSDMVFHSLLQRERDIDHSSLQHMRKCVQECRRQDQDPKRAAKLLEMDSHEIFNG
jgi:hypothetical protein